MTNPIQRIAQKHTRGCGIACLAMVTGHNYEYVTNYFGGIDLNTSGVYFRGVQDFLVDHGYAYAVKCRYLGMFDSSGNSVGREPWPCEPFADVHICEVTIAQDSPVNHNIVMLRDGTILDPLTDEARNLSDYHQVLNIMAVVKMTDAKTP